MTVLLRWMVAMTCGPRLGLEGSETCRIGIKDKRPMRGRQAMLCAAGTASLRLAGEGRGVAPEGGAAAGNLEPLARHFHTTAVAEDELGRGMGMPGRGRRV